MSSPSIIDPQFFREAVGGCPALALVVQQVKQLAFWAAIVLPVLHLSLLATGLESRLMTLAFLGLVGLNVCALWLGHQYGRD
jgi:hypothetical protein